jgi:hypothetical protein
LYSTYVDASEVKAIVDELAKRGPAYVIGLLVYIHSPAEYNVVSNLEPAFGREVANEVWSRIQGSLGTIYMYSKVRIEGKEEYLINYLKEYISKRYFAPDASDEIALKIVEESNKRWLKLLSDSEEVLTDKKTLSIACAVIEKFKDRSDGGYPKLIVRTNPMGFIEVRSSDGEYFSEVVSSVLGLKEFNVRKLFCKYLLGFIDDWYTRRHSYRNLVVYPSAIPLIKRLASEVSAHVKIFTKAEVESVIRELYKKGDLLRLSAIDAALSNVEWEWSYFLESFFGKPPEILRSEVEMYGLISRGFVNPLIYDYVKEALRSLYLEALEELVKSFAKPFKEAGYDVSRSENLVAFTKPLARPINVLLYPWPKEPYIPYGPEAINVVVIQGIPTQSMFKYLEERHRGALWLFMKGGRVVVASNTYRSEVHEELLKILSKSFSIEFFELVKPPTPSEEKMTSPHQVPSHIIKWINSAMDVLEGVVAGALEAFGFSVEVDKKVKNPRTGTEVEIDVWGEKMIEGTKIIAYASCKNWDNPVEVGVVREEFGRLFQMPLIPHLRMLVAPSFTDSAEKEAVADGFLVIEVGEKASRENIGEIYAKVYEELNKLFAGVAPKWMQELAKKVRILADEIRKIGDELERAGRSAPA